MKALAIGLMLLPFAVLLTVLILQGSYAIAFALGFVCFMAACLAGGLSILLRIQ